MKNARGIIGSTALIVLGTLVLVSLGVFGYLFSSRPSAPPKSDSGENFFPPPAPADTSENSSQSPEAFPRASERSYFSPAASSTPGAGGEEAERQKRLEEEREKFSRLINQFDRELAAAKKNQNLPPRSVFQAVERDLEKQRLQESLKRQLASLQTRLDALKTAGSKKLSPAPSSSSPAPSPAPLQQDFASKNFVAELQRQIQGLSRQLDQQRQVQDARSAQELLALRNQLGELKGQLDTQKQLNTATQKTAQDEITKLKGELESFQASSGGTAAGVIGTFKSATVFVRCQEGSGSGTAFARAQNASVILTNWHVIAKDAACLVYYGADPVSSWDHIYVGRKIIFQERPGLPAPGDMEALDFGFLILEAEMVEDEAAGLWKPHPEAPLLIPQNVIGVVCPPSYVGERLVALGYPGQTNLLAYDDYAQGVLSKDVLQNVPFTATQGIISGLYLNKILLDPDGRKIIPLWNSDVKIDSGNSGGGAYSLDNFCYIGPPSSVLSGAAFGGTFLSQILDIPYIAQLYPALFNFFWTQTFGN